MLLLISTIDRRTVVHLTPAKIIPTIVTLHFPTVIECVQYNAICVVESYLVFGNFLSIWSLLNHHDSSLRIWKIKQMYFKLLHWRIFPILLSPRIKVYLHHQLLLTAHVHYLVSLPVGGWKRKEKKKDKYYG